MWPPRLLQCQSFRWHVMLFCVKLNGLSEKHSVPSHQHWLGGGFLFLFLSAHSLQAQVITIEACTSLPVLNCLEAWTPLGPFLLPKLTFWSILYGSTGQGQKAHSCRVTKELPPETLQGIAWSGEHLGRSSTWVLEQCESHGVVSYHTATK